MITSSLNQSELFAPHDITATDYELTMNALSDEMASFIDLINALSDEETTDEQRFVSAFQASGRIRRNRVAERSPLERDLDSLTATIDAFVATRR